eukprot:14731621-Alexandrium_andersonii.AAC.1
MGALSHSPATTPTSMQSRNSWARSSCKIEGRLGGSRGDLQEANLLNRIIRWTPDGAPARGRPPSRGAASAGPARARAFGPPRGL